MYPLNVTLVNCHDAVQRNVLSMLINHQANLEAQYADVESAVAALRDAPGGPRLFIVATPTTESLPRLRQMMAVFAGNPILALVDAMADPAMLLGAMRAGATQVVALPIEPDDFRAAMDCIAQQFCRTRSQHQVIAVSGVTGGCGATALAVNFAYEIADRHGQHVILSELHLQIGKLAAYLDIHPDHTTFDLLNDADRLDLHMVQQALTKVSDRLDVLSGEYRAITPVQTTSATLLRLIDYCRSLSTMAIFDVPCTYDDMYFETLAAADQVVLVGEQKIPSIRTLKLVCDALNRIEGSRKLHIVFNRYDARLPGFGMDRLRALLGDVEIQTVCNDFAGVMASINHGRPLRLEAPRSPALADINRIVETLVGTVEAANGGPSAGRKPKRGSFGRIFSRFGL